MAKVKSRARGPVLLGLAAVVLIGLFFVLRPGGSAQTEQPAASPTPAPTGTHDLATPTADEEPPDANGEGGGALGGDVSVVLRVEEGRVVEGPRRAAARLGDTVHITVVADVADEVHVHGYDLFAEVSPDEVAHLELEAGFAGVFEIELEEAGLLLTRLEVRP